MFLNFSPRHLLDLSQIFYFVFFLLGPELLFFHQLSIPSQAYFVAFSFKFFWNLEPIICFLGLADQELILLFAPFLRLLFFWLVLPFVELLLHHAIKFFWFFVMRGVDLDRDSIERGLFLFDSEFGGELILKIDTWNRGEKAIWIAGEHV